MTDRGLRLRLGLFVALSLVVLSGLVILFGRSPTLFSNRSRYVVRFPEAPGLAPGVAVRKSGVRIGEVTRLDLDGSTGEVRVSIEVENRYQPRVGEEAVISRGLLSGDTSLDFIVKINSDGSTATRGDPLDPETEIRGVPPVSARSLLTQASEALPSAQESVARMLQTFQRIETAVPKFEKAADEFAATNRAIQQFLGSDPNQPKPDPANARELLKEILALLQSVKPVADDLRALMKDNGPEVTRLLKSSREAADAVTDLVNPDNRKAVAATLKNIQTASDDLTKTIRLVAILADQAEKTLKELNARLAQSDRVLANIDKITKPLGDNAEDLTNDVRGTVKNLNTASAQLSATLAEAQATLKALNRSDGTLNKVLTDPMLYNNLNDATVGAARVLLRVEKIARDLEVFADKIARKPESLGVGGALRPNSGLKESPTAPLPPSPGGTLPLMPSPGPTPSAPPIVVPFPPVSSYKPPVPVDRPPPP